jgi:uncharacterized protein YdeI (YjbR/CyaY-like superfamily)
MPAMKPKFFPSAADFHSWLLDRYRDCAELWVGFYKKSSGKPSMSYAESVDEALCFGWIDGVRHSHGEDAYLVRFTPRKPRSQWSAVNLRRARALRAADRLLASGLEALRAAANQPRKYSYEQRSQARLSPADQRLFRSHHAAWDFFEYQPPWYRRTATFWVVSAKKEETRARRLARLIADSAAGRTIKPLTRNVPKRP